MLYINNGSEKGVSVKFLIKIKWLLPALMIIAGPLQAGSLKVVASIPPIHSITAQVMEGAGVPALLIKAHQSPHHFSLKPSTAATLNRADVIIIVHPHLEEGLARALEDKQDALVVLVDHAGDPHAWLDPLEGVAMAAKIAEALSTRDPANAALYHANARALQTRIGQAPLLLLDEPTAALDIHQQELTMQVVRDRVADGAGVVVVLHDLTIAAAHADRIVVLRDGRVAASGPPVDVLDADLLSDVYRHPIDVLPHPRTGESLVLVRR